MSFARWILLFLIPAAALAQPSGNRLAGETSPYLLLHAKNPVNWYPWGKEALERARAEQKPVFLSIGYYTCHWCHVMERESFSNPEIAAVLNRSFIAIKVDREERPDIDRLYIAYLISANGTAGWPANLFLTPDLKPFAGGVYFPPDTLKKLLLKIAGDWSKDRERITQSAGRTARELAASVNEARASSVKLQSTLLDRAFQQIAATYDRENGGFGGAPKFPRPSGLELLLRTYARKGDRGALDMALGTLRAMARGGIHDHTGGGFHRYSTDAKWRVPHYEKMLYDQAQLAVVYTEAWQITREPLYEAAARDTLDFTLRELHLAGGGFGSALDADSPVAANQAEMAEGAFYLWTVEEIEAAAGKSDGGLFAFVYGMEPGAKRVGLYQRRGADEAAKRFGLNQQQITASIAKARAALLLARNRRPRPPLDDKVVTAWNALAISAFARAGRVFEEPRYLAAGEETARFLEAHSYDATAGRLWRTYRSGNATMPAVLDDYADTIAALIDLYQAGFNVHWLQWAAELQKKQDELFEDRAQGGYFDAPASDIALLARTREAYDGAEPSPNSTAAMNLLRLAQMTGREEWRAKAARTLAAFGGRLAANPDQMPALASALDFSLSPARHIVIAGDARAEDTREMLRVVNGRYLPNMVLLLADGGPAQAQLATGLPFLEGVTRIRGKATAYICEDMLCKLPTTDPKVAAGLLEGK